MIEWFEHKGLSRPKNDNEADLFVTIIYSGLEIQTFLLNLIISH